MVYQGRVVHVASYADKFLFTSEQLNQPVERLSGGERARVLIAKLMLEPADLLLLDEPTNDLDIQTLEILESSLLEYTGALVLVTHDRFMLDRVSTVVLGLDGKGGAERFGDYAQWEEWARNGGKDLPGEDKPVAAATSGNDRNPGKKKLSYIEAREYAGIEAKVDAAEERLNAARDLLDEPSVATNADALTAALHEMELAQTDADALYQRWAELTEKAWLKVDPCLHCFAGAFLADFFTAFLAALFGVCGLPPRSCQRVSVNSTSKCLAAVFRLAKACVRSSSVTPFTWSKRAMALRTWLASVIGSLRLAGKAKAESGSCAWWSGAELSPSWGFQVADIAVSSARVGCAGLVHRFPAVNDSSHRLRYAAFTMKTFAWACVVLAGAAMPAFGQVPAG